MGDMDIFANLDEIRAKPGELDNVGVQRVYATIPVRKPTRQEFVRTHPDESMRINLYVIELKEEREIGAE